MSVSRANKYAMIQALRERYMRADRAGKGRVLDEVVAATGYTRKRAIRLLRHGPPRVGLRRRGRPRRYSSVVVGALRVTAEASDWLCGKRLAPFLAELVPALEAEGVLELSDQDRAALVTMSAATIDRRLGPFRRQLRPHGRGTTKPGTLLKRQVPIHTYTPWAEQRPGFLEIDLVAHCGTTTAGQYLNTLVATDVATGWTECQAIVSKGQVAVVEALEQIRARLPFPLLGIDSDNGSEFLNAHLLRWCAIEQINFTRSRPYWKNDQAHVEQKNWSIVRKLIGYDRYESEQALAAIQDAYVSVRLWINHWQPTLKLIAKEREGTHVRKRYDVASTPYRRVLAALVLSDDARARLEAEHAASRPVALRHRIEAAILRLHHRRTRPANLFPEAAG